jgi:hypothetical protein
MRNAYKISIGNHERKRSLGSPRCKWEYNIKINIKEIECGLDSCGSG